ncbi:MULTISPECIES: hypothetical protein [unclassified Treponema]|uniref:LIC_12708 family protein n=1 Tax=unclassified Treponema TaxID=2638727 RepID=UPI0020A2AEA0|nr:MULTISPECIES: hypothetical protein [unclassified Treponema]UTC67366.1 hypothetical protein E4O06_01465 [Treponema sp. OMZ 789]UTC70094.1 hypothetical protein E4O01_01460 [Treponema sp. OMZ 790]UTC72810.1 hypothetical protein E4O02_01460 [Treponema sp. OMZ 791]
MKNLKKILLIVFIALLFACRRETPSELEREEKFSLNYGLFESELNLFNLNSTYSRPDTQILMKEGIFYIVNSGGQKILKLSSFGDLLTFFYNPDTNIEPSFMKKDPQDVKATTRAAIKYSFNHPALLTVTSSKHLFVVDSVLDERIEYDHEENLALRDIILRFDENGNFVDYLGQEGFGGTPFPSIEGIHTNSSNDIIVVCRTQTSLKIYWYNSQGDLLYKIPIFFNAIPNPYEGSDKIFSSIDKIIPDFNNLYLYIKIDYYLEEKDAATKANLGVSYDKSCLYFLNIKTGKYDKKTDIDAYEATEVSGNESLTFKKVYEMIGITENGWCYLLTPTSKGYALEIMNLKSQKKYKKDLIVSSGEMFYNTFHVSSKGIISALLARDDKALVVWWRADKIIGDK